MVNEIERQERRLDRFEEQLDEIEFTLREKAATAGLRTAKRFLKKVDLVFSAAGYDPHDVKVIFDPVPYVVFNGMSRGNIKEIVLLAKPPETAVSEKIQTSIRRAVEKGNLEFKVFRVDGSGTFSKG